MKGIHLGAFALIALGAAPVAGASDFNPLGFYVGAGAGRSTVRADASLAQTDVSENATGWKAILGVRPLHIVGAEFEYLDFGSHDYSAQFGSPGLGVSGTARSKAEAVFGTFYAPIPVPLLDVFGKLGVAHVQTDVDGVLRGVLCPISSVAPSCPTFASRYTTTGVALGAGAQVTLDGFAVRMEYERIEASRASPDLLSLGVTWTF